MPDEYALLRRAEQVHHLSGIIRATIQPAFELIGRDGGGGAMMQPGKFPVRGRRHDRDRVDFLSVRSGPGLGQRGETEWRAIAVMDEERTLPPPRFLPFIVAVGRNQNTPPPDRILEGRLLAHGLGARIDQQRKIAGILDPGWNEAPAHQPKMALAMI